MPCVLQMASFYPVMFLVTSGIFGLHKVISIQQFTAYIFIVSMVIYVIVGYALGLVLKRKYITSSLRVGLYKAVIRPVVNYDTELWTLTNKMESALMTWEGKS
jgi:hypothetical protein